MEDPNELPPGERVMPGKFESERLPNEGADPAPPKLGEERLPPKPAPLGVNERVLRPLDRGTE